MPLNEQKYRVAKVLNGRYQERMWGLADREGTSFDDPEYTKVSRAFHDTSRMLHDYEAANRKTDEAGKLTEDAPSALPVRANDYAKGGKKYFFEPHVAEVKHRIASDPDFTKRLGLEAWTRELEPERPNVNIGPMDPATGVTAHVGVQQPRTHLDAFSSNMPEYGKAADEMWREAMEDAKKKGDNLVRYKNVYLGDDPVDYLYGGLTKGMERVVAPAMMGLGDVLSVGSFGAKRAQMQRDFQADSAKGDIVSQYGTRAGGIKPPEIDAEAVERRNPLLANIARIGAYAMPMNAANSGSRALLEAMSYGAAESALGKGVIAGVAGGTVNAGENYLRNVNRGIEEGKPDSQNFRDAANETPGDAAWGGVLGVGGELLAGGARALTRNTRESPSNVDLRALRNAHGDTAIKGDNLSGYVAPPEIRQDLSAAAEHRHLGTAGDIAARRVAPKIQESLDEQLRNERANIAGKNEAYFAHPAYQQEESGQEAVNAVIDLTKKGWTTGAVDNQRVNVNPKKIRRIGDALQNVAQHRVFVNKSQAEKYAADTGGYLVDGHTAAAMFPTAKQKIVGRNYAVIVANKMNAGTLTELEQRIDEVLDVATAKGVKDDPVYQNFQRTARNVRDRFPYYEDAAGNLVAPPGWSPPPSSEPAPPVRSRRASKRPSQQAPEAAPPETLAPEEAVEPLGPEEPEGVATEPAVPPTAPNPESLPSEDVRPVPPEVPERITPAADAPSNANFEFTPERIQAKLGVTPEEAQRIALRLNGGRQKLPSPEPPELGSEDFSMEDSTPLSMLASGDARALPPSTDAEFTPRSPEDLQSGEYQQIADSLSPDDARQLPPSTDPEFTPRQPSELGPEEYDQIPSSIAPEDVRALPPDRVTPTRRSVAPGETPLSSLAGDEASLQPQTRNDKVQRTMDLAEQTRDTGEKPGVEEAAKRASYWIDAAFTGGDAPPSSVRTRMIAMSVAHQLGRALSSEEMQSIGKFLVPVVAGAALGDAADEGDDNSGAAMGAMVGGIVGGGMGGGHEGKPPSSRGSYPRQPKATLPDGKVVEGFSALRRQQHLALSGLEEAGAGLGADSDKSVLRKVLGFNQFSGTPEDALLLKEAEKLGLTDELYRAAATLSYGRLRDQGLGGAPTHQKGGFWNRLSGILGQRIDAAAGMIAGEPTTYQGDQGLFEKGSREFLNMSGGRLGARLGDESSRYRDLIQQTLFGSPAKTQQKKEEKRP